MLRREAVDDDCSGAIEEDTMAIRCLKIRTQIVYVDNDLSRESSHLQHA